MSKFNRTILTFCGAGVVILLYCCPFYISVSIILPAVFIFLYCDYKSQQPKRRVHSHAVGLDFPSYVINFIHPYWIKISKKMQKYYVINQFSENKDISVPSPYSLSSRKLNRPTSIIATSLGNHTRSPSNLDENRLRPNSFYSPNSNYSFNASPIRVDDGITSREFRNLHISDMESRNSRTRNQSLTPLKMSPGDSVLNRKHQTAKPSPKNIQSIAGPLLASTRYNLSLDSVTFTDAMSPGLSSRVVTYAESASRNHPATHQRKYSGPGQFPTVQLSKSSRLPMVRSQAVGRSPVRIRIAPPEYSERRNYISPDPNSSMSLRSSLDRLQEIARPDRLQDVPRKRIHAQLGEVEDEATKKQRISDLNRSQLITWTTAEDATTSKRGREESPKEDSKTKRTKNNEISSSLSSSRNLRAGTNKRKQTQEEWSQTGTLMPVGKQAKKSLLSNEDPSTSTEHGQLWTPKQHVDIGSTPLTSRISPEPTVTDELPDTMKIRAKSSTAEDRTSVPTKMTVSPARSLLYEPSRDVSGWVTIDSFPDSEMAAREKAKLAGDDLKNQREQDAKRRLRSMMLIVGDNEKIAENDVISTPNFTSALKPATSVPTFSTSTPTTTFSADKTTPQVTSLMETTKSGSKHVHFADNLTQVKTFTSSPSHSLDSGDISEGPFGVKTSNQSTMSNVANSTQSRASILPTSVPTTSSNSTVQEVSSVSTLFALGAPKSQNLNTVSSSVDTTSKPESGLSPVMPTFGNLSGGQKNGEISFGSSGQVSQEPTKPSPGFSFGSNLTSTSAVPAPDKLKSNGLSSTFPISTPTTSTSTPVFGQSALGKSVPVLSVSGQIASTSAPTFNQSTPTSSIAFGQNSMSSPLFGQKPAGSGTTSSMPPPNVTILFGQTGSTPVSSSGSSAFSIVSTPSSTTFGSDSSPSFGGLSQAPKFTGTDLFTANKDKLTPLPSFGAPMTTSVSSGFGTPVTSSAGGGFGSASSSFSTGVSTSVSGGFGAPATTAVSSVFGVPASTSANVSFGAPPTTSANVSFGAPVATSASVGFGAPVATSASVGFGTPVSSSTNSAFSAPVSISSGAVFGSHAIAKPTPTNLFSFGSATTTESQSPGFGAQPTSTQAGFVGFGSLTSQPSVFGGKPSAQLQQGGFSFGGNSVTTGSSVASNPVFGTKSDKQIVPSFSVGSQNISTNVASSSTGNAQGFKIDFSQTNKPNSGSGLFGAVSSQSSTNSVPSFSDSSKQAADTTQNAFQFGANSAKPFSFGGSGSHENSAPNTSFGSVSSNSAVSSTLNPPNAFGQSVFGSHVQQTNSSAVNSTPQKPASLFSFGASSSTAQQQQPSSFGGFGSNAGALPSGGFAFGGAQPQESQQVKPFGFGASSSGSVAQPAAANPFGQATQVTSAPAFQFGSATSSAPGGFNFGGPPSNLSAPAFGGPPTNNAFQMAQVPQQPGQGMFSIGSGSSAPRARAGRLMRRQR